MEDAEEFCIEDEQDEEQKKTRPVIKNAMDLQRLKLEKLMKNPDKPILIPEPPKEKDFMQSVPTFVRNVMGSSAGAGSGEFHVYRHLRRKEYARQKYIQAKSIREQLDDEYRHKLEQNRLEAEAKTAKRRAKRLKKKQKMKQKGKKRKKEGEENQNNEDHLSESSESEDERQTEERNNGDSEDDTGEAQSAQAPKKENEEHTDIGKEQNQPLGTDIHMKQSEEGNDASNTDSNTSKDVESNNDIPGAFIEEEKASKLQSDDTVQSRKDQLDKKEKVENF